MSWLEYVDIFIRDTNENVNFVRSLDETKHAIWQENTYILVVCA